MIDKSLNLIGLSKDAKFSVYKLLAAILNLGNIEFVESSNGLCVSDASKRFLNNVATLTKLTSIDLETSLLTRTIKDVRAIETEIR